MPINSQSGAWVELLVTGRHDGTAYILAIGEIDSGNLRQVAAALRTAIASGSERVDLDIGLVTFIDAATINTLIQCRNLAAARGCTFRLLHPSGVVARVLDLTHTRAMLCGPDAAGPDRLPRTAAGIPQADSLFPARADDRRIDQSIRLPDAGHMRWPGVFGRGVTARVAAINGYAFPSAVRQRFSQAHPDLSADGIRVVEDAIRQWFRLAVRRPRARVAMPSMLADDYWQEFALHTRDYADFCEAALGRLLQADARTARRSHLRETLLLARHDEPAGANGLPLLFHVDSDLAVPDGPHYLADCGGRGQCFGQAGMICVEHVDGVGRPVGRGWRIRTAPPPGDLGEGSISGGLGS